MATCKSNQTLKDGEGHGIGNVPPSICQDKSCPNCNFKISVPFGRSKDKGFTNWIQSNIYLQTTKEGLHKFVETTSAELSEEIKNLIQSAVNCRNMNCTFVKSRSAKCITCNTLKDKLKEECNSGEPTWTNATLKEMEASPNNVAKLFMPPQCSNYSTPEKGDITALLSFMAQCKKSTSKFQNPKLIDEVRDSRNDVMHSGALQIDDQQLENIKNRCLNLLKDTQCLVKDKDCQQAIALIEERAGTSINIEFVKEENIIMENHIKRFEDDLTTLKDEVESPQNTHEQVSAKLEKLEERLLEMTVTAEWLGIDYVEAINTLARTASDLSKKTEEKNIETIANNKIALEEERRAEQERKKKDELRRSLLSMYQGSFQQISVFPDINMDLSELYVNQDLKIIHPSGEPGESASVTDVFYKDGNISKNIILSSEPGLGKSMFCKQLVRLWCEGHTLDNAKLTGDQNTMSQFDLLFYIDLREKPISTKDPSSFEIAELIHKLLQLRVQSYRKEDIHQFLSQPSILVVIDSIDELGSTQFPLRGPQNQCCIVSTCRPWKLEALKAHFSNDVQHIEIVGLAKGSAASLANIFIKLLSTGSGKSRTKNGDAFMKYVEETKELHHFLNAPLLVKQMTEIWFSEANIGTSEFEIYSKIVHHQMYKAVRNNWLPNDAGRGSTDDCRSKHDGRGSTSKYGGRGLTDDFPSKDAGRGSTLNFPSKDAGRGSTLNFPSKDAGRGSTENFPYCSKPDQCPCGLPDNPCRRSEKIMWKVAKLAFTTFFGETGDISLVFDNEVTNENGLSSEEVDLCLKIGILTQHRGMLKIHTEEKTYVSFPHRTHQELFASIFISNKDQRSIIDQIRLLTNDLDRALELDKVLVFLNQQSNSEKVVYELTRLISEKSDEDPRVQEYRRSSTLNGGPNIDLIKNIQTIVMSVTQRNKLLVLSDIYTCKTERGSSDNDDHKVEIRNFDKEFVKSLHAEIPVTADVLKFLKKYRCLQKLELCNSELEVRSIYTLIFRNNDTLETLGLVAKQSSPLDLSLLGKNLRRCFTSKLSSLALSFVNLSHKQFAYLLMPPSPIKRQITLNSVYCQTHGYEGKCIRGFNT